MMKSTRRGFLGTFGAAAIATVVPLATPDEMKADTSSRKSVSDKPGKLVESVNILQGTDSTPQFSRGNTLPLVAMPFGMSHWTLQTTSDTPWFFNPHERRMQGIRCTHQLSPWLSDYGHAVFFPFTGEINVDPSARSSSYRPEDAMMRPHHLRLELLRSRTMVDVVPTERCAMLRLAFTDRDGGLLLDLPGKDATIHRQGHTILATVHANSGGVAPGFGTYYAIQADQSVELDGAELWKTHNTAAMRFRNAGPSVVNVKIGTSFISAEQAILNLERELGNKSFDEVKDAAEQVWEDHLGRAIVEGGTSDQRRVFYSCMYRALLFPRIWHEPTKSGEMQHWSPYNGKVMPGVLYADHGYWDVYRAWYPWMSLLFPERLGEILQAWVNASQEGGWLPQFPCPGYRACMTGSLIDAVFADAAVKGIEGFDLNAAYQMLHKHATQAGSPAAGYGRRGIEDYLKMHYVAAGVVEQAAAETLDAAYGDFCIAQIAKVLGKQDDAAMFQKRSENWKELFDPDTKFLRGKTADGKFLEPFDPIRWGDPYVEGSAWQHRFDVPHNPEGLMNAMGGAEPFARELELMLTQQPAFHVGFYGREIHEMSEMAAVPFGQYAHGNQPVHHVLTLFSIAGRRDRMQYWVRRVLTELYTPDNFAGDEDTGSMSAWFLFHSMGLYPLCPGRPEYVLGSPLFDRVTLRPQGGAHTVIESEHNSVTNVFVQKVLVNGKLHEGTMLPHEILTKGETHITFDMGSKATLS